ncbi:hypothetical protein [Methylobacterium isbiliense]|uniref:Uncharacterized protein n=1 Tax=Methylobacterium isbiliense TaxID=315478 RepID=A0ABQ4SK38_9HYPH|nr:hypothetical protein [Methylobacterium isbiliense]MDN3627145.1 hypothetical protein [Methylobacterium isbiliense]GJE03599.1 hypothetical protein GMJLKIPL_5556 [Methylobacterium isbiliense]
MTLPGLPGGVLGLYRDVLIGQPGEALHLQIAVPCWEFDALVRAFGSLEAPREAGPAALVLAARRPRHPETDSAVAFEAALGFLERLAATGDALPLERCGLTCRLQALGQQLAGTEGCGT